MTLIEQLLESIKLTQELVDLVKDDKWEPFAEIESTRQKLIHGLDVESIELEDAELFRSGFKKLIDLNEELEQLCIHKREEAVTAIKKLKLGAKANKAYGG